MTVPFSGSARPEQRATLASDFRRATLASHFRRRPAAAHPMPYELAKELDRLSLRFLNNTQGVTVELEPILEQDIRKGQKDDEKINEIRQLIIDGKGLDFH